MTIIKKAISNHIDFLIAKTLDLTGIPWTKISKKIGTKSKDDCRNRWYNQVFNTIHDREEYSVSDELALVKSIKKQEVDNEKDIDFSDIANDHSEDANRYRWQKLKKIVNSRCGRPVSDIARDLVSYFKKHKSSKKYALNNEDQDTEQAACVDRHTLLKLFREKLEA